MFFGIRISVNGGITVLGRSRLGVSGIRCLEGGGQRGRNGHTTPTAAHRSLVQDHSSGSEEERAAAAMGGAREGSPIESRIF